MCNSPTVLLVEDDVEIRSIGVLRLSAAGFRTLTAGDGRAGIEQAHQEQPDVIVMDIRMPIMDGLTALAELKACSDTRCIPVVMLSASVGDQQRALDAGARYFIKKPYQGTHFVETVRAALHSETNDCMARDALGAAGGTLN